MKRTNLNRIWYVLVVLVLIILALFVGVGVPTLLQPPGAIPQTGYIPPAPPTAAPAIPPSPTLARPTWTPSPLPSTPTTAASTSSPTSTALVSQTSTLGPDKDTRGDAPPNAPATGGSTEPADMALVIGLLAAILTFVSGGGIAHYADRAQWFKDWKPSNPNLKMFAVYAATLAAGGLLTWLINYAVPNWWGLVPEAAQWLIVSISMFAVSQKWHDNDRQAEAKAQAKLDRAIQPPTFNVTLGNGADMEQLAQVLESAWHRGKPV